VSEYEVLLEPLLQELDLDYEGLHVVAIGGGHGLAQGLMAIQDYADVITAVVTVADDGGSSGRLSPALGIPPPGDIRRALLALSPGDSVWRDLVSHRFEAGDVAGHSLGNLIIAALTHHLGAFDDAIATVAKYLDASGEVIPVASSALGLEAVIDGATVRGQVAVQTTPGTITELRVTPGDVEASPAAIRAIEAADQIVLGPQARLRREPRDPGCRDARYGPGRPCRRPHGVHGYPGTRCSRRSRGRAPDAGTADGSGHRRRRTHGGAGLQAGNCPTLAGRRAPPPSRSGPIGSGAATASVSRARAVEHR
jgi:hypothetical protein